MKFQEINLDAIQINTHNDPKLEKSLSSLFKEISTLQPYWEKIEQIAETAELPYRLGNKFSEFRRAFMSEFEKLVNFDSSKNDATHNIQLIQKAISGTDQQIHQFLNEDASNKFLSSTLAISMIYSNNVDLIIDEIIEKKKTIEQEARTIAGITEQVRIDAGKLVVRNYANIFSSEATKSRIAANRWLTISIVLMIGFILLFFLSIRGDWFSINGQEPFIYNGQPVLIGNVLQFKNTINYHNLISKLAVISLAIYLINFSFKQYAIKKHLETLDTHRNNALNSYNFFVESININDPNSRGALMLQVSKAIYDHTNSGYIQEKQTDNTGIIEFTKFMGNSKPEA